MSLRRLKLSVYEVVTPREEEEENHTGRLPYWWKMMRSEKRVEKGDKQKNHPLKMRLQSLIPYTDRA
jgi:hypothetical protein